MAELHRDFKLNSDNLMRVSTEEIYEDPKAVNRLSRTQGSKFGIVTA